MGCLKTYSIFYLEQDKTGAVYEEVSKCGYPSIQGDKYDSYKLEREGSLVVKCVPPQLCPLLLMWLWADFLVPQFPQLQKGNDNSST